MMILHIKRTFVIFFCTNIWRIQVEQCVPAIIYLYKVLKIFVFDIDAAEPFLYFFHIYDGMINTFGAGSVGAVIRPKADFNGIEKTGRTLNIRQAAYMELVETIKELLP